MFSEKQVAMNETVERGIMSRFLGTYIDSITNATYFNAISRFTAEALEDASNNKTGPEYLIFTLRGVRDLLIDRHKTYQGMIDEYSIMYHVAIFDSLVNNLTRYLVFNKPDLALGKSQIETRLLISSSGEAILTNALSRAADAISRQSFWDRFQFIEKLCGTPLNIPKTERDLLKDIIRIRNTITHDSRSYNMSIVEGGLQVSGFANRVTSAELDIDIDCMERVVPYIYKAIAASTDYELDEWDTMVMTALSADRLTKRTPSAT